MVGGALGGLSWHMPFAVYLVAIPMGIVAAMGISGGTTRPRRTEAEAETTVSRIFRQQPVIFIICSLMFYINFHLYAIVIYLPQILETYGVTNAFKLSLFITAITASAGVISFFYWRFRARLSFRAMVTFAVTIDAVAYLLISLSTSIPAIAVAVSIFGIGMAFIIPTCMLWIGDLVPPSYRGRFTSYLLMTAFVAQFSAPILLAPVAAAFGLRAVFITGTCSSLLWLAVLISFRKLMNSPGPE
jgi:MFS family permease